MIHQRNNLAAGSGCMAFARARRGEGGFPSIVGPGKASGFSPKRSGPGTYVSCFLQMEADMFELKRIQIRNNDPGRFDEFEGKGRSRPIWGIGRGADSAVTETMITLEGSRAEGLLSLTIWRMEPFDGAF